MRGIALLAPLLTTGCGLLGTPNLEGTWLFLVDRNPQATGDCVDPDDTSTAETVFVGPAEFVVDIYKLASGETVVPLDGYLVGDWNDDKAFVAEWTDVDRYEDEDYSESMSERQWMRATWADGMLSGKLGFDEDIQVTDGGTTDTWACSTTWDFDAVEVTSSENKYVED